MPSSPSLHFLDGINWYSVLLKAICIGRRAVGRVRHRRLHDQAARRRSGPLRPHADLPLLVRDTRSLPSGWDLAAIPWALARPLVRGHGSAHRYRVCARESYQHRGVRRHVRLRRLLWRRVVGDAAYGLAPGLLRRGAVLRAQAPRSRALRRLGASQPRYRRLLVRGRTHIYAGRHKYRGRRRCRQSGQRARSKVKGCPCGCSHDIHKLEQRRSFKSL
mmetsp:Transcript_30542/g.81514  ORF Transcript_30542/g.81514 Transcript_30542/m.81514 type:complete len:218 (+) Transcript_30542:2018-2671(+)